MSKNRIGPEFIRNNFYRLSNTLISYVGGAIFTILVARILSPELLGSYTIALSFALILMTVGDLGLSEAVLRYVSLNYKNSSKAKSYFYFILRVKITVLMFLAIVLIASSKLIAVFYGKPELTFPIMVAGLYIFFYSLMQEISNLFNAFKDLRAYAIKEAVFQLSRLILISLLFLTPSKYLSAGPIMIAIFASIAGTIFSIFSLLKRYPQFFKSKTSKINKIELYSYLKFLSIGSLSVLFLIYTDILILGKFVDLETVGFYRAASSLALFLSSIFVVTVVVYPVFARINDKTHLNSIISLTLKYMLIISIPLTIGSAFTANYFIRILFGYSYLPSSIIFYSLCLMIFLLPTGELFKVLLNSKGKSDKTAKIIFASSILNIFLNFLFILLLIPHGFIYAAAGAGAATIISRGSILILLFLTSRKEFGISLDKSIYLKPLLASLIMATFLFFFNRLIYGRANFILVGIEILIGTIIYFLTLFVIKGFSKEDIIYIRTLISDATNRKDNI